MGDLGDLGVSVRVCLVVAMMDENADSLVISCLF